ncbi:hypothetical protein L917_16625 [Phytophthora nicotianae]|uniref:Reverse transcriptase domain-containing protein n=1 Tax=Phytophthora nicotianae TaxID=4792 RepID=W2KEB9_PHYNI|nr:hypothetical protein L917_16625 [Phytophthora nicotianae]
MHVEKSTLDCSIFLKGFWQLPLAEKCQEWMSYMTDEKIFTPRRVPQGCSDAAIYFQKTMEKCFASLLYKHLLVWIDDLLLYADDIDTYLDKLAEFFSFLNDFGLNLSVKKSSLYMKEVKWCGKIIDANGVRHDPARIEALRAMPYPSTAGELQQFICAINWMRESLVDYARQVAPLQRKLDDALASTRRTKRVAAGIAIEFDAAEKVAFDHVKDMLATAVTLDFPDDSATSCLLTDASDVGWAVIVTQVQDFDIKVPLQDQQHRLIECLSGTFTGSQLNWTVIEKAAFPIAFACDKLDYLLLRPQGFRMFCDHRNLIHVFAPDEHVKKHVKGKLLRWAMKLMNFTYIIEHIAGPHNFWADMISRWAGNHASPATATNRIRTAAPATDTTIATATTDGVPGTEVTEPNISTLRPLDDDNFNWPTPRVSLLRADHQGSHFKNEVVSELSRRLRTQQQFTPAYCPWINRSVERVNRDILQVIRTMILEYKIHHSDWVYLVPMVQSSINHTAVPKLGNRAPVELFTGLPCPTPLSEFYLPSAGDLREVPASENINKFLANLRNSIYDMHKVVEDQRLKQRLLNKKRARGENLVNFTEGDYVLRSIVDEKSGNKLLVTWVGPYRILRADAHSFLIEHLITGAKLDVHVSRLKFYADASLNVTEELLEHISAQVILLSVEKLKSHRWNDMINDYEVLVQWKGLEQIEDSYEPLTSLARDVSTLVTQYVAAADQQLQDYWQQVTSGGGRPQQHPAVSVEQVQPAQKMNRQRPSRRRRQRRRQATASQVGPADSHEVSQVSTRGDQANSALQLLVDQPGPEDDQNSSTVAAATKTFHNTTCQGVLQFWRLKLRINMLVNEHARVRLTPTSRRSRTVLREVPRNTEAEGPAGSTVARQWSDCHRGEGRRICGLVETVFGGCVVDG